MFEIIVCVCLNKSDDFNKNLPNRVCTYERTTCISKEKSIYRLLNYKYFLQEFSKLSKIFYLK